MTTPTEPVSSIESSTDESTDEVEVEVGINEKELKELEEFEEPSDVDDIKLKLPDDEAQQMMYNSLLNCSTNEINKWFVEVSQINCINPNNNYFSTQTKESIIKLREAQKNNELLLNDIESKIHLDHLDHLDHLEQIEEIKLAHEA